MTGSVYNISELEELFQAGQDKPSRVICAGVFETAVRPEQAQSCDDFLYSMRELAALTEACGLEPAGSITQNLPRADGTFYVGTGKLEEIREVAEGTRAQAVIFNDSLTPAQFRAIQKKLGLPILDRTALILEIFRSRARTRESMLQVEYARLSYIRTRLVGMWDTLGRKGGASGSMSSRGEGETQLELDRRQIDTRIAQLKRELKEVAGERELRKRKRSRSRLPLVSLIGYTNAGKSTIMNAMLERYGPASAPGAGDKDKKVFEADMLFATLDSSVRRISPGMGGDFLLSDTVGFIHRLPTALVEAFKSTLEEAAQADLLVLVADCSDSRCQSHLEVTEKILSELGAGGLPRITVYNKADLAAEKAENETGPDLPDGPAAYPRPGPPLRDAGTHGREGRSIYISAKDSASVGMLAELISEELFGKLQEEFFLFPFEKGSEAHSFMEDAEILDTEYSEYGTLFRARVSEAVLKKYRQYRHQE